MTYLRSTSVCGAKYPIDSLKASGLIYGEGFAQDATRTLVKRVSTWCWPVPAGSCTAVMLTAVILISLKSAGPVFILQERVGRGGRPFLCVQFVHETGCAEGDGVARWASVNDALRYAGRRVIRQVANR